MREAVKCFGVPILVLALLPASSIVTRAQSAPVLDMAMVDDIVSNTARPDFQHTAWRPRQVKARCKPLKRALVGGMIGTVAGMVAVNRAAKSNGGAAGVKGTLLAGGLGGALGAFLGLTTCR